MLNEKSQYISTKESLIYCISEGIFVYLVCAIPRISLYLTPPKSSGNMDICLYTPPPPFINAYIISFVIFTFLGIYFLRKLNLKNRLVHFSLLGLVLTIGSGVLTSILEFGYYLYIVRDTNERVDFSERLKENWFETLFYDVRLISWAILFLLILIPFTVTFLTTKSIFKKIAKHSALK